MTSKSGANAFAELQNLLESVLADLVAEGLLPEDAVPGRAVVEPPRDRAHGDAATNAALVLARAARTKPMALAEPLARRLSRAEIVKSAEAAPPGFVNLRLEPSFWLRQIGCVLEEGERWGRCTIGEGRPVNVEYCSANPTGPLHVGHARGAIVGDALANLLETAGWHVTREYYVNDGGAQIEALGRSIHHRYREALGAESGPMPEGLYPLEELIPVARAIAESDGEHWLDLPEEAWLERFGRAGVEAMMARIKEDLALARVRHDVFTFERTLIEEGRIDAALDHLDGKGLLYLGTLPPPKGRPVEDWEPVEQLLFRSSSYGDVSDRPLRRSNGAWTYFAADLAYHLDKIRRGHERLIDVWGADHGGYVERMKAAIAALSEGRVAFDVRLCQLVNLTEGGRHLRMSKRAGRIVTLRDIVEEVGPDVVRFIMLTRKNDATLDFDLEKVVDQSKDNPVFYVQYAHARICSVLRHAREQGLDVTKPVLASADHGLLVDRAELDLVRQMALFPRLVETAARAFEPHRITFYLHDLVSDFHALWTRGKEEPELRFLREDAPDLTAARLSMLEAVRQTIAAGLAILGVQPVEELH